MTPSSNSRRPALEFNVLAYRDCYECSMAVFPDAPATTSTRGPARDRVGHAIVVGVGSVVAALAALLSQLGR